MITAPIPENEVARLEALRRYEILDSDTEQTFDNLTALAARICAAPIALISLVDENRQWFKSCVGLAVVETTRDVSFCAHAILESGLFIIPDALADPRFADNPLVVFEPHIRFYAGAVLRDPDGTALGTLCVLDRVPRDLAAEQQQALQILADQTVVALQLRRATSKLARSDAEHERLSAQLRDSEAQFRDLVEGSLQGIVIARNGKPLFANQAYADMFGYEDIDAVLSLPSLDALYSAQTLDWVPQFRAARAAGTDSSTPIKFEGVKRDGSQIWLETQARNVIWQGEPTIQSTVIDVTERERAEESLRLRSAALDVATDGLLIAAVQGQDTPRLIYASPAFLSATGYTESEVLGRDCSILQSPNADPSSKERLCEALTEERSFRAEVLTPRKTGEGFWNLLHVEPLHDANGELTHFVCVQTDITQRKKIEQALAHSVEELEDFVNAIAHDLKAPLRAMRGFSQVLVDDYGHTLDAPALGHLEYISNGAQRMAALLDSLLEYSHIGRGEFVFGRVEMSVLMSRVVSSLAADIESSHADVRMLTCLPVVEGHAITLERVFQNIIANAIKFSAPDTPPKITISCRADGEDSVFAVRDNGIGIDEAYQQKVFDIFERLHNTEIYPGTGMGLAIVKKGVMLHRGAVWFESELGGGTTLFVRLPRQQS